MKFPLPILIMPFVTCFSCIPIKLNYTDSKMQRLGFSLSCLDVTINKRDRIQPAYNQSEKYRHFLKNLMLGIIDEAQMRIVHGEKPEVVFENLDLASTEGNSNPYECLYITKEPLLMVAVSANDGELVKDLILHKRVDINRRIPFVDKWPHYPTVADFNTWNNGDTALHYAARLENQNMYDLLLSLGANPQIKNDDSKRAIEVWGQRNQQNPWGDKAFWEDL